MPTHIYLTEVTYYPEKREIIVQFEGKEKKFSKRFSFIPCVKIISGSAKEKVSELLLRSGIKSFSILEKEGTFHIYSSYIEVLKKISNVIGLCTNKKPVIVEAERQFLLEKEWSYFDSFSGEELVKQEMFLEDFSFILSQVSFDDALRLDESTALFLLEKASLSNLLCFPIQKLPNDFLSLEEILLENIYFKNSQAIDWEKETKLMVSNNFVPYSSFDSYSSIDFSPVWLQLFSKNFFNLGNNTFNCSCCKPIKLEESNLLPNSLIEVSFKEDYFYFTSSSDTFSLNFHNLNPHKDQRLAKKKEFFTNSYPVGPFFKNEKALVLIDDAKKLLEEDSVSLCKEHSLAWACKNKESFIYLEIGSLLKKLDSAKKVFIQKELFSRDFPFWFSKTYSNSINRLLGELPFQLTNSMSSFFSPRLAKAILSAQEATLFKFKAFSEKEGYRVLFSSKKRVVVRGHSSLALAKAFSAQTKLPRPEIASFASKSRIS